MRTTFLETLLSRAREDPRIFLITPDMGYSILENFFDALPTQSLNMGIMEQNAVGFAAGLSMTGRLPYVYSIVPFVTMRCFEQVRVDVAYMNTNVRLIGIGGGYTYGAAGSTHHSIEDISLMRSLPNMTVCCPSDNNEVRSIAKLSFELEGPMYIRLGRNKEPTVHPGPVDLVLGKGIRVREGRDLAILATGNAVPLAMDTARKLKASGYEAEVYSIPFIKPLDRSLIEEIAGEGKPIFTVEEHNIIGGLGSAVAEILAEIPSSCKFKRFGIPDHFTKSIGDQNYLRKMDGLLDIDREILSIIKC
jgi:transketolase